jgi:hypothetical protein
MSDFCIFGNLKNLKIWLAHFLPILNFPLHALPVWGRAHCNTSTSPRPVGLPGKVEM